MVIAFHTLTAQVSINTDDSTVDPSAMLDVQSTDKGMLIPRIDFNDKPGSPATGLLIYVIANGPNGSNAFYYYTGSQWIKIIDADSETDPVFDASVASGITQLDTANWNDKTWVRNVDDITFDEGRVKIGPGNFGLHKLRVTSPSNMIGIFAENNGSYSTLYAINNGSGAAGTFMGPLSIVDGTQGAGKVLTSNSSGGTSRQPVSVAVPLQLSGAYTGVIKGTHTNGNYGYLGSVDYGIYGYYDDNGNYGGVGTLYEGCIRKA